MSDQESNDEVNKNEQQMDEILADPKRKELLLKKLGVELEETSRSVVTPSGKDDTRDSDQHYLTPIRGMAKGSGGWPPFYGWPVPGPWWPQYGFVQVPTFLQFSAGGEGSSGTNPKEARTINVQDQERPREEDSGDEKDEDRIDLLDDSEALELIEFDPSVDSEDSWKPPRVMESFLDKHFNRCLSDEERKAIRKDFPKPDCPVMSVPKLDEDVKEQLKKRGKDPHFGAEKTLYKVQEQVLDVAGPLTCLWSDLLNKEAKVTTGDTLMLVQRSLVLLGSVSQSISLKRRKIAWSRINPKLKSLADQDYEKRETNLFGPGFLEKASKKLEADKAISKVADSNKPGPSNRRKRFSADRLDLRNFLDKGPSARYGGRKDKRQQPYTPYTRFAQGKYFQQQKSSLPRRSVNYKDNNPKQD